MTVVATVRIASVAELEALALGLVFASWQQMKDPKTRRLIPPLYSGRIHYQREPDGEEVWQTALQTAKSGHGDCEDLCIYLCGQLWATGEDPLARPKVIVVTPSLRHVVVRRGDGRIEDPSKRLGM